MSNNNLVWVIVAVLAALVLLWLLVSMTRRGTAESHREEAAAIRETAARHEENVVDREERVALLEDDAAAARAEAEFKAREAEQLEADSIEQRAHADRLREKQEERWREADRIDPDVPTDSEGRRLDTAAPVARGEGFDRDSDHRFDEESARATRREPVAHDDLDVDRGRDHGPARVMGMRDDDRVGEPQDGGLGGYDRPDYERSDLDREDLDGRGGLHPARPDNADTLADERDLGRRDDRGFDDRDLGRRDDRGFDDRDLDPRDDRGFDERDLDPRDDRGFDERDLDRRDDRELDRRDDRELDRRDDRDLDRPVMAERAPDDERGGQRPFDEGQPPVPERDGVGGDPGERDYDRGPDRDVERDSGGCPGLAGDDRPSMRDRGFDRDLYRDERSPEPAIDYDGASQATRDAGMREQAEAAARQQSAQPERKRSFLDRLRGR
ncbi:hypothetical protein ACQP1U_02660 [Actinomycetota bacterium]